MPCYNVINILINFHIYDMQITSIPKYSYPRHVDAHSPMCPMPRVCSSSNSLSLVSSW